MGAKVSPTYATLVLGYLEELMYERITIEKGHNFGQYIMENWKRFLDDCFSIWPFSGQDLNYFENVLNSLHKDIQFKPLIKSTQIPFLDVLVLKSGTLISTDIFHKVTDSQQYLIFNSCHPKHTKINIPFSLAKRLCTIVSDKSVLLTRLKDCLIHLFKENIELKLLRQASKKRCLSQDTNS